MNSKQGGGTGLLVGMNHEKINFFGINFDLLGK
jgi:hypothetical protein